MDWWSDGGGHSVCHSILKNVQPIIAKTRKTTDRRWSRVWPQLATYPPFSGPACCCDVTYLYQTFSQHAGPGRLWISLGAGLLYVPNGATSQLLIKRKLIKRKPAHTQKS